VQRLGPRPLGLHLATAAMSSMIWRAALPMWKSGSLPWSPALESAAEKLRRDLEGHSLEDFAGAVELELRRRFDAFLRGIETYRAHSYRRTLSAAVEIWSEGTTRLFDHGSPDRTDGPAVLIIPSLVNRAYILDLAPGASLVDHLAAAGQRPLLIDWGSPSAIERDFTLTDYVAGRLGRALDAATAHAGKPVAVVGYCMGGNLALPLAQLKPDQIESLALLATPWDSHAATGGPPPLLVSLRPWLESLIDALRGLPVDVLQAIFFALDPMQSWTKFRRFSEWPSDGEEAHRFVALEDWANDGVALAGPVARECILGWYLGNTPARGQWLVAGAPVDPAAINVRALIVVPERDRIVPTASAMALAEAMPRAQRLTPKGGHVGMIVGGDAEAELWRPLTSWLANR
jgi:polyhydroxyalkanoate synthase subunit PhaC